MTLGFVALYKAEQRENIVPSASRQSVASASHPARETMEAKRRKKIMDSDNRSAWLKQLDQECPYQVVLPRRQLFDDGEIMNFLLSHVGKFDMYVEDDYAAFVRYCFADPMDAEVFRARFEPKDERFKLAG
jgi:hypothetical protein